MKRRELLRDLETNGCFLKREGGNHNIVVDQKRTVSAAVPRNNEIDDFLAKKICDDLGIPRPTKN